MDDITHCPRCGSADISVEPIMRGSSDGEGVLIYYRCAGCNGIISRLSMREMAEQALKDMPTVTVAEGFARRTGHAERER